MKFSELAEYCKSIDINCDQCEHVDACMRMVSYLEDQSPYGIQKLVQEIKNCDRKET